MPGILVILVALAGFAVSFGAGNLVAWLTAGRDRAAGHFGLLCLAFASYATLQVGVLSSTDLESAAHLLRLQGTSAAALMVTIVLFGAAFVGSSPDLFDRALIAVYTALGVWSLLSPAGYWFASLTELEPVVVTGGVIHQPHGVVAWTYFVSIVLQYPLFTRLLARGAWLIRRGAYSDGWLLSLGAGAVLIAASHDHLVDFGWLSPPYLAEYPFPLLILAVALRNTVRHNRRYVELQQLQATLARSEARLRDLYDGSSDAIFVHDMATGAILDVNETMVAMYGYDREDCLRLSVEDLSAPGDDYTQTQALLRLAEAQEVGQAAFPWQAKRKDGTVFPVEVTLKHSEVAGRQCVVANVRDMTERQATVDALRREQIFVSTLLDSLPGIFYVYDGQLRLQRWNRNHEATMGYTSDQLRGRQLGEWWTSPADRQEQVEAFRRVLLGEQARTLRETRLLHADGTMVPYLMTAERLECPEGPMMMGVGIEIRSLVDAQAALRESEERYRSLFDGAGDAILILFEATFVDCNARALQLYGCERDDQLVGHSPYDFSPEVQPDGTPSENAALARIDAALAGRPQRFEWVHRHRDGSSFLADVSLVAIELDGKRHLQAIVRDITEQRQLEERLRQSQRLEAIGHLAGGVAHDFNNLLTPILGHVELLLDDTDEDDAAHEDLRQVLAAAERAQRLTRQLLTFGRKAVLEVRAVDLARLLGGMEDLLRKLLREDVELRLDSEPERLIVRVDRTQLEQVVLNLAVNARDAMPDGGLLSIRLGRCQLDTDEARVYGCPPGSYAILAVSDTGVGMRPEVRDHIFEPFFTTKEVGRGTGLGLATVFGVVRQHGGAVHVHSEPGAGSTFRVLLPLQGVAESALPVPEKANWDGTELILVVEDDEVVRKFTCRTLRRHGYETLEAGSPSRAIALLQQLATSPRLILTDVVMPGMNGRHLYEILHRQHPSLRVLYMSGYSGDTISHHGVLEPGITLLQKPFGGRDLLAKVREVLDAGPLSMGSPTRTSVTEQRGAL